MAKADLICVNCKWKGISYLHYGIDLGNGEVIHLARDIDSSTELNCKNGDSETSSENAPYFETMRVRRSTMIEFQGTQSARVVPVTNPLSIEETLANATSCEGQKFYHLTEKNCEHFARWCKTGEGWSHQVDVVHANVRCLLSTSTKILAALTRRSATSAALLSSMAPKLAMGKWIPSAIACDVVDLSASRTARSMGYSQEDSKRIGLAAGCATAGVVGLIAGGPVGCSALIGCHIASTQLAERVVDKVSKHIGNHFSR